MASVQHQLRDLSFEPTVELTTALATKWRALKKRFPKEMQELVLEEGQELTLFLGPDPSDSTDEDVSGHTFFAFCDGFEGWYLGPSYPKEVYTGLAGIFGPMNWKCYVWESTGGMEAQFRVRVTPATIRVTDAS